MSVDVLVAKVYRFRKGLVRGAGKDVEFGLYQPILVREEAARNLEPP